MKRLALCFALLLLLGALGAQATANYTFTYAVSSYQEISGGTLLGNESTADQRFVDPAVPLGGTATTGPGFPLDFPFYFNGYEFDRVALTADGWLSLGQSWLSTPVSVVSSSQYSPLSNTSGINPPLQVSRVSALGVNLAAQTGASLRIETIGTAPNRIFVAQWHNYRKSGASGDSYNFQIRLEETTNQIVVSYGTMTNNTTAANVQVGLRAEPANAATNYRNRTTTTDWSATTEGAAANATCTLNSSVFPASGTSFAWLPPTPMNSSYTVGNGGNFTTISAAINFLNTNQPLSGIPEGGTTFNILAGEVFTEDPPPPAITATGGSLRPIYFQKSGAGNDPLIKVFGTTANNDTAIKLQGCDWLSFQGIAIRNADASTALEYGFYLEPIAYNGCRHITIDGCDITLDRSNPNSRGIYTPALSTACNTDCSFSGNSISDANQGIHLTGYSVSTHRVTNTIISGNVLSDIAGYAIYAQHCIDLEITNNQIAMCPSNTVDFRGISFAGTTSSMEFSGNTITGNSTGAVSYGMYLAAGSSTCYNNIIQNFVGTSVSTRYGIRIDDGNPMLDLRNNIFVDRSTPGSLATARATAIWKSYAGFARYTANTDRNIYYAGTPDTQHLICYDDGTSYPSLLEYKNAVGSCELGSLTENVPFVSTEVPIDVHIRTDVATYVESNALPVTGWEADFDSEPRHVSTPDIGADEGNFMITAMVPDPAQVISPLDNAIVVPPSATLNWSASVGGGVPTGYLLYFGTDNPPTNIVNGQDLGNVGSYDPNPDLQYLYTYYWKIVPYNATGYTDAGSCPVWTFQTHALPLTGTYTIGSSGHFPSFSLAITHLNAAGAGTGGVTFQATAGELFAENPPAITCSGSSENPILFTRFGDGDNPKITPAGGENSYGIRIEGGDYITFDHIDIANPSGSSTLEYGYWIRDISGSGPDNITIQNSSIVLSRNITSVGIMVDGVSGTLSSNNISILNNTIDNATQGMYLDPYAEAYNTLIQGNTITNATTYGIYHDNGTDSQIISNSISFPATGTAALQGIYANALVNATVAYNTVSGGYTSNAARALSQSGGSVSWHHNTIHNLQCNNEMKGFNAISGTSTLYNNQFYALSSLTENVIGMELSMEYGGTAIAYNNLIYNLSSATTSSYSAIGIQCNGTDNVLHNNYIYDLSNPTASTVPQVIGIQITNRSADMMYNTIYLNAAGSNANFSSAAIHNSGGTSLQLTNNILCNLSTPGTTGRAVALWNEEGFAVMDAATDYNILYAGTPDAAHLISYTGTAAYLTLDEYKAAAITHDQNSFTEATPFVSTLAPYDLHIVPGAATLAEGHAIPISGISTDYDNDPRNAATPDIGADEGDFSIPLQAPSPALVVSPTQDAYAVSLTPLFSWYASSSGGTPTGYRLYLGTDNPPTNLIDNLDLGNVLSYQYTGTLDFLGSYYWKIVPYNSQGSASACPVWSFSTHQAPLTGTWTIGSSGYYPDFTHAINYLNASGVGTGGAVFMATAGEIFTENPPVITATGTPTVYNNMVCALDNPASSANPQVRGIYVTSNANLYYNSVLLNCSATAATSSSAALYLETGTSIKLINNIFSNKSAHGSSGMAVAMWKEEADFDNITSDSNNNIWYAGSPGAQNLICYYGTLACITLEDYKTANIGKDQGSFTENTPFASETAPHDLHLDPLIPTYAEGNALVLAGFGTDFDSDARHATHPDIGADEGSFSAILAPPAIPAYLSPANGATSLALNTTLNWSAGSGGGMPDSYNVYFGATNPPPSVATAYLASSYAPVLLPNTTYYWKIDAVNTMGTATGPIWSFTTRNDYTIMELPFLESFEEGNTQGSTTINRWIQALGSGTNLWTVNSTNSSFNRAPRSGSFNVTLSAAGDTWLFRPMYLQEGNIYELELWARQYRTSGSMAFIQVKFGSAAEIASMTNPIIGIHEFVDGDYQSAMGSFTAPSTGIWYLGINGICSTPTNYLSLDDITLREYIPSPVFSIDPPSWNYGMVASGTLSDAQAFIITNAGDADLIINQGSIYLSGADAIHFTLTDPNSDLIIAPQATATIYVNFCPLSLGIKTATLNIIDNVTGRNLNEIPLSGRGIGPLEPPFVMDFEEGWLDWITQNENQVNKWQLGTAAPYRNSYSAYISQDSGTTNSYSLSSSSYVHFYHDVIFPADITGWRLKFNWKSMGEAGFDYLSVHITDTSFVPVAGEYFTLGQIGTEYSGAALWQMVSLDLDPSLAGQTRRLIFSWHNDGGGGAQTPAAIDNIRIVPQGAALAIPQNVSAYASGTSAFLSWDLIPEANDYIIEHSDMFDGAFEPLGCAGNGLFSTPGSYLRRFFRILATD